LNNQIISILEDQRKSNGGARAGAGRKPKADEIALIETMDAILAPKIVWENLSKLVKSEDHNAIKTWLSYRFGMPKQQIAHSGYIAPSEAPITPEQARSILKELEE